MHRRTALWVLLFLLLILTVGTWSVLQSPHADSIQPTTQSTARATRFSIPPEAANDPALYPPGFASLFYAYGPAWNQNPNPDVQRQVD